MSEVFTTDFQVRDYECDIQGIVNNSVYQNYLEHARHEYLLSKHISFHELAQQGIHLVVKKVLLNYKAPLRSGDRFQVTTVAERTSKVRFHFAQNVVRADGQVMLEGVAECTSLNPAGKPFYLPELDGLFLS